MTSETDWLRLHQLANAEFDFRIRQILPEYWGASTPCDEWDVQDLVNHVVVGNLVVAPLLEGEPVTLPAEGDADEVDILGGDPEYVWEQSRQAAIAAFAAADLDDEVTLPDGRVTILELLRRRTAEIAVHAWDLAVGLGVDDVLDEEIVVALHEWVLGRRDELAAAPAHFEPQIPSAATADLQSRLLNLLGRET